MADKKQETIAEIVAWLRTPQDGENGYLAAWRAEIADRIEAAHKREMEAVIKRNHLGNGAKLREALEFAEDELWAHGLFDASKRIASALAAPPRNCDVGMAEEQAQRYSRRLPFPPEQGDCEFWEYEHLLRWAQMPYEEGGAE